jgi:hypothetical protein
LVGASVETGFPQQGLCVAYRIEYSPEAEDHLKGMTARRQHNVLDEVDRQLAERPLVETRNRKPMRPNPIAP